MTNNNPMNPIDMDKVPSDIKNYIEQKKIGLLQGVRYALSDDGSLWTFGVNDKGEPYPIFVSQHPRPCDMTTEESVKLAETVTMDFIERSEQDEIIEEAERRIIQEEPTVTPAVSPQAQRVLGILEEAKELFLQKNKGYGDTAYMLGAKGQYSDIYRKVGKLKHTLWEENPIPEGSESNEEMLMDLIGHALLTIDFLRSNKSENQN